MSGPTIRTMNATTREVLYELGAARDLVRERPSVADLQRALARALVDGDRRRAEIYGLVIARRVSAAQRAA